MNQPWFYDTFEVELGDLEFTGDHYESYMHIPIIPGVDDEKYVFDLYEDFELEDSNKFDKSHLNYKNPSAPPTKLPSQSDLTEIDFKKRDSYEDDPDYQVRDYNMEITDELEEYFKQKLYNSGYGIGSISQSEVNPEITIILNSNESTDLDEDSE